MKYRSAMAEGLAACHECHQLVRMGPPGHVSPDHHHETQYCPRCNAVIHLRKSSSLQRTWALLIAALILYVPANVFPIMRVSSLGRSQSDTILSGVAHLAETGMWPLAAVVFFASIVVPSAKLMALVYLLRSVSKRSTKTPEDRTRLYRLTEALGRWSMVDIYVVAMLSALVQMGAMAQVEAELGAIFFGAVVVITMIAAESFDPRLIWDRLGPPAAPAPHSGEMGHPHG